MNRLGVLALAIAAGFGVVWASEPGEPLDCSDWVFNEPGLSCTEFIPGDCADNPFCLKGSNLVVDVEGNMIIVEKRNIAGNCGGGPIGRVEIILSDGASETVVAYVDERCPGPVAVQDLISGIRCSDGACNYEQPGSNRLGEVLRFDPTSGRLFVTLWSRCHDFGGTGACYDGFTWMAAFEGFTTTFELLQTYDPPTSTIGFRVPYMPEGFQYADYFDTYYGDLATVGDWSHAQPLQCGYPSISPQMGDWLTVPGLPDPTPGNGVYWVTAVTYGGETRYGRQASGGVLSGRDPEVLPSCE